MLLQLLLLPQAFLQVLLYLLVQRSLLPQQLCLHRPHPQPWLCPELLLAQLQGDQTHPRLLTAFLPPPCLLLLLLLSHLHPALSLLLPLCQVLLLLLGWVRQLAQGRSSTVAPCLCPSTCRHQPLPVQSPYQPPHSKHHLPRPVTLLLLLLLLLCGLLLLQLPVGW
jgi:hypothetical protein